jgi:arylsulfatase A
LYDLSTDPKEQHDLAEDQPEIVQKMETYLEQAHTTAKLEKFQIPILDH